MLELAADERVKMNFENTALLSSFWIKAKNKYPELAEIALKYLLLFPLPHLCKIDLSTMSIIETKHRHILDMHYAL